MIGFQVNTDYDNMRKAQAKTESELDEQIQSIKDEIPIIEYLVAKTSKDDGTWRAILLPFSIVDL